MEYFGDISGNWTVNNSSIPSQVLLDLSLFRTKEPKPKTFRRLWAVTPRIVQICIDHATNNKPILYWSNASGDQIRSENVFLNNKPECVLVEVRAGEILSIDFGTYAAGTLRGTYKMLH